MLAVKKSGVVGTERVLLTSTGTWEAGEIVGRNSSVAKVGGREGGRESVPELALAATTLDTTGDAGDENKEGAKEKEE